MYSPQISGQFILMPVIILCSYQHLFSPLLIWGIYIVLIRDVHFLWCWVSNQASTRHWAIPPAHTSSNSCMDIVLTECVRSYHVCMLKGWTSGISLIPRVTSLILALPFVCMLPHLLYPVLCFTQSLLMQFTCFHVCAGQKLTLGGIPQESFSLFFVFVGFFKYWFLTGTRGSPIRLPTDHWSLCTELSTSSSESTDGFLLCSLVPLTPRTG